MQKNGDQNVIKKQSRIQTLYMNVTCRHREAFHNMSVSVLTIVSLFSCYLLTIFLSMFCFPMYPHSLFDCFSTCCTNTPTYVHYFLADFLTQDLTKKMEPTNPNANTIEQLKCPKDTLVGHYCGTLCRTVL